MLTFSLKAVASARPRGVALRGHFFGFAFLTADFLAPFLALLLKCPAVCFRNPLRESPGRSFTRVTALAHGRPRRLVIGHVLWRVRPFAQ